LSKCINSRIGNLLHAYELGGLDEENRQLFELHLLECDYCFRELDQFSRCSLLLVQNEDVRLLVGEASGNAKRPHSVISRIAGYLWPQTPLVFKPGILLAVVILLCIPAYFGLQNQERPSVLQFPQGALLSTYKDSGAEILSKSRGDWVKIAIELPSWEPEQEYQLLLLGPDERVIYEEKQFTAFDEYGIATLALRISDWEKGTYRIRLAGGPAEDKGLAAEYIFRIVD
jgi:hypothetical protein